MAYKVVRSTATDRDLSLIFDFLYDSYRDIGDPPEDAFARASARVRSIEDDMAALGGAPFQGTLWPDLLPGLRWVTKNRAVFSFQVDETDEIVRVLAVFFGGQDHRMTMLIRLSQRS